MGWELLLVSHRIGRRIRAWVWWRASSSFTTKRCRFTATSAGGGETKGGEGDNCFSPMLSSILMATLGGTLMTTMMKWRNGWELLLVSHRIGRRIRAWVWWRASSSFTTKRCPFTATSAGGGETEGGEGDSCFPPTLSSILMATLGGKPNGTFLGYLHEPFALCLELLKATFDAALEFATLRV